jgi:hypothetical protein
MGDVKTAKFTEMSKSTLPSIPGPSNSINIEEKRTFNTEAAETRNTKLEDGINRINEKQRPMVDIQEYFVCIKLTFMS